MADMVTFTLDGKDEFLRALDRLATEVLEQHTRAAAEVTGRNIAREAEARLRRQLGPNATGETAAGIKTIVGDSAVLVVSEHDASPTYLHQFLPNYIEHGTLKRRPGSHASAPRPYFDVSVRLEEAAHRRRMEQAVQDAIDDVGLGGH